MLMTFRYFKRKWTWIVIYGFAGESNLNSFLFGIGFEVNFQLEDLLFDNSEIFV